VCRDERVMFEAAAGSAAPNRPITLETIFRIGSITKAITAAAVFRLHEAGALSVDDPVGLHLPARPASWSTITLRHLLTHTSGIPNFTALPEDPAFSLVPATPHATLARVKALPLEFEPGTRFAYSNSGYLLVGLVLERVTGASYAEGLRHTIFEPLGMRDTGSDVPAVARSRLATGDAADGASVPDPDIEAGVAHAAGGLASTVGTCDDSPAACSGRDSARGERSSASSSRRTPTRQAPGSSASSTGASSTGMAAASVGSLRISPMSRPSASLWSYCRTAGAAQPTPRRGP